LLAMQESQQVGGSEEKDIERKVYDRKGVSGCVCSCDPSITDFPIDAIYPLGLNALMRGAPVTREELQAWIAENSPSTTR
jgi:hypothetical protein